jgi:tetratricopeptide (TPR) repeat protein
MNTTPIVRQVLVGAAQASLDVAGAALLPGAWPILRGALKPVLERLQARMGGEDITATPARAEEAADLFEADRHLQEILQSNLVSRLDTLVKSGETVNADVQKLMLITAGNEEMLRQVLGGIDRIEERLKGGVTLDDATMTTLVDTIVERAATDRSFRELTLREMGPVGDLAARQVGRLQLRANELLQEGAPERAVDELQEGMLLIAALLHEAPTDVQLRLQLGFLYKTAAQACEAAGDDDLAQTYVDRADEVFDLVTTDAHRDFSSAIETSNLLVGLGNMEQEKGAVQSALRKYELAAKILPENRFAWHDIFSANTYLVDEGQADVAQMREALDQVKRLGRGQPGFSNAYITELEGFLAKAEAKAGLTAPKSGT